MAGRRIIQHYLAGIKQWELCAIVLIQQREYSVCDHRVSGCTGVVTVQRIESTKIISRKRSRPNLRSVSCDFGEEGVEIKELRPLALADVGQSGIQFAETSSDLTYKVCREHRAFPQRSDVPSEQLKSDLIQRLERQHVIRFQVVGRSQEGRDDAKNYGGCLNRGQMCGVEGIRDGKSDHFRARGA